MQMIHKHSNERHYLNVRNGHRMTLPHTHTHQSTPLPPLVVPIVADKNSILPGWFLEVYVLATFKAISGWVPTCDSVHSWWLNNAAPLGDEVVSTMIWYPTQTHSPDTKLTSPSCNLIMLSAWLGGDKYKLSHWFDSTTLRTREFEFLHLPKLDPDAQLLYPSAVKKMHLQI